MPLWLRKFTYSNLLENFKSKEQGSSTDQAIQQGIANAKQASTEKRTAPVSYSTKASKK